MRKGTLKRSKKPMKRGKLRQVSKSPKRQAELEADALWKQRCLERDKGKCRFCGRPAQVVHHVFKKAKGLYPKLRHIMLNGLSSCHGDHFTVHHDPERGRDMVLRAMGREDFDRLKQMALVSKADSSKYDPKLAIIALKGLKDD